MRSKGEGTIFRRGDKWRGYVTLPDGRRKYFSAETKTAAAAKLRQLVGQRDTVGIAPGRAMTVGAWLQHWLTVTRPSHSAKTDERYRYIVERNLGGPFKQIQLPRLSVEAVEAEYERLELAGLGGSVRHQAHAILHAALKMALMRGHVPVNVASLVENKPRAPKRTVRAMSDADVAAVRSQLEQHPRRARWHLSLAYGPRPGEALGLEWSALDLDAGTIRLGQQLQTIDGELVVVAAPKTSAGAREFVLAPYLLEMFRELKDQQLAEYAVHGAEPWSPDETPRSWVFTSRRRPGYPVTPSSDSQDWRRILARAGVPHVRIYAGRHTAISWLLANGVDEATVAHIVGHADPSFTRRVYSHTVDERIAAAAQVLEAALQR